MKFICFLLLVISNSAIAQQQKHGVQQQVWSITEVMYHDVVNPPAAARFYSYSLLTGYEILSRLDKNMLSFQRHLKNYPVIDISSSSNKVNKELCVLYGILETGKNIIPSGYLLEEKQSELLRSFSNLSKAEIDSSVAFAKKNCYLYYSVFKNRWLFQIKYIESVQAIKRRRLLATDTAGVYGCR